MAFIEKEHMRGFEHVQKFREYLDYLEEHLENVRKAFNDLSQKCDGLWWVGDDTSWHSIRQQVCHHDISKFSEEEFVEYQMAFFPVKGEESTLNDAWEHHKNNNTHHHESLKNNWDIVHMIIDWTAMGYKFGDTAQEYYENNMDKMTITDEQKEIMYEIFNKIAEWKE